jgi:hypothetical protein
MKNKMKSSALAVVLVIIGLLIISVPMSAHHGTNISYDRSKATTVKGKVTEFRFANPHPQLYVDVTDKDGKVTNWGCEIAANPYQLILSGWSKERSIEALKPGTPVTVTLAPSRAGTPTGELMKVFNEKGEELLATVGGNGPQQ